MATIVLPAAKVIEAAEKVIADINANRLKIDERLIAVRIKHLSNSWFRRKPATREEAIKSFRNDMFSDYPCINGWGDLEKAKDLLRLAKHGDPVTLNQEDCRVLF